MRVIMLKEGDIRRQRTASTATSVGACRWFSGLHHEYRKAG